MKFNIEWIPIITVTIAILFLISSIAIAQADEKILHIKFNNDSSYGEDDQIAYDYTNNGHNVVMTNINYTSGIEGLCIHRGVLSNVYTSDKNDLSFGNGLTDTAFSMSMVIDCKTQTTNKLLYKAWEYEISTLYNRPDIMLMDWSSGGYIRRKGNIETYNLKTMYNNFYHVVFTYDGLSSVTGINIYINGQKQTYTDTVSGVYTAMENHIHPFEVGQNGSNTEIITDDVILYNHELNQTEITDLYNSYFKIEYPLTILSNDLYDTKTNLTVFENGIFYKNINYGDTFNVTNLHDYTVVLHEDIYDELYYPENIPGHLSRYSSVLMYIVGFIAVIGLLIWIIKKW